MMDAAVSHIFKNMGKLIEQELSTHLAEYRQIRSLCEELQHINHYLNNLKGNEEEDNWVSLVRSVADRAEAVIDTFLINMDKQKRRNDDKKFQHSLEYGRMPQGLTKDIESVTNELTTLYNSREKYRTENQEGDDDHTHERITPMIRSWGLVEEIDVVNFENHAEPVMERLIKGGLHRAVVSIVGMGGLGKTTLARRIYNDRYTKKQFSCRAWVYVSQEFQTRDLLLNILQSMMVMMPSSTAEIYDHYQMMNESELEKELKQFLANTKYLIVLDDVWSTEVWDGIKAALPDNLSGSRVLISSRFANVASHGSSIHTYFLPLLNKDDSWELFLKRAFAGNVFPSRKLEEKGRQIVEKCNGLPLAITAAAAAAACLWRKLGDDSPREWSLMAESLIGYLRGDPARNFFDVLTFSYKQLHPHLKLCFLYFGVFPEGFEITARRLIRLWIAEGFIEHNKHRKVEDVAEDYLEDLIGGSLIVVVKRRSDGGVKSCSIHNVLRDICISKGLLEKNLALVTDHAIIHLPSSTTSTSTSTSTIRPRRLSIHSTASRYISSVPYDTSGVRTLMCFEDQDELNVESFCSIYKGFRLLKVLDLGSIIVHKVPNQVEKLIHIRYMRMNAPNLKEIPSYISNLSLIQTLDLRESEVTLTQLLGHAAAKASVLI